MLKLFIIGLTESSMPQYSFANLVVLIVEFERKSLIPSFDLKSDGSYLLIECLQFIDSVALFTVSP